MPGDDLHDPLGYNPGAVVRAPRRGPSRELVLCASFCVIAGAFGVMIYKDNGMGGEPFAVAKIELLPKPDPSVASLPVRPPQEDVTGAIAAAAARTSGSDVENESGVRVVRQGGGGAPGALIIQVPNDLGIQLTPAPDRRLVEKGKFGPLPKIGPDGSRASDVYARPMVTATNLKMGAPRIALVIGGMGLNQQATQSASAKLPGAVTLAFAPYGAELERQVARVREAGHEVMLQAPMEPFDLAESPGPHTLQTSATPEQNIEDLHWMMSRFSGYVGISNFLGGKFLANEAALSPVLREVSSRGLFYLEDGLTQSAVSTVAAATGASAGRVDVIIDAAHKPEAIDAELARLEKLARQNGSAIGIATGLPATVEQIARFARGLEKRGVALIPLSSLVVVGSVAPTSRR